MTIETTDKTRALIDRWLQNQSDMLHHRLSVCGSPIEQLLMMAMVTIRPPFDRPWPEFVPDWFRGESNQTFYGCAFVSVSDCVPAYWGDRIVGEGISGHMLVGLDGHEFQDTEYRIVVAQPQLTLSGRRIRPDFVVLDRGVKVVVECDGHEFHERTKEQAENDKSRDRLLSSRGWKVLRFTGSEIYRDPVGCVNEIEGIIEEALLPERLRIASRNRGVVPEKGRQ